MNIKRLSSVAAISAIALGSATPALAEPSTPSKVTFSCEVSNGIPATILQTEDTQITIFNWKSDRLSPSKNPLKLCNDVTAKLNNYSANQSHDLSKLTFKADVQSQLPTICATDDPAACNTVLFTLSPTEQPEIVANSVLNDILDKSLQSDNQTNDGRRGLQSVSHSVDIFELILGRKVLETL